MRQFIVSVLTCLCYRHASAVEYDYLMYAEHYPPSMCEAQEMGYSSICRYPKDIAGFTTHGLW